MVRQGHPIAVVGIFLIDVPFFWWSVVRECGAGKPRRSSRDKPKPLGGKNARPKQRPKKTDAGGRGHSIGGAGHIPQMTFPAAQTAVYFSAPTNQTSWTVERRGQGSRPWGCRQTLGGFGEDVIYGGLGDDF